MTVADLATTPRIAKVLDAAGRLTLAERLFTARWLLDSVLTWEINDNEDWQQLGLVAFEKEWDNEEDAIYDDWRTIYQVGRLSAQDLGAVDHRLRIAMDLG